MKMQFYKLLSIILFSSGISLLINTEVNITGAVIGIPYVTSSAIGIVLILISGILFVAEQDEKSKLEKKLGEIENVKIRRELLSDAHRAERFAERGYDVNGLWDPNKTLEENKKLFFAAFYNDVDNEIRDGFRKSKNLTTEELYKNLDKFVGSEEYTEFKERALEKIIQWNHKVLSGEFVPLTIRSVSSAKDYLYMMTRVVYYGPKNLKNKSKSFYENARKTGKVIVAHEIVNPEAIEHPEKLKETPHIHWELEYI